MAKHATVVYDCKLCGNEIAVKGSSAENLTPIYCCGVAVTSRKASGRKPAAHSAAVPAGKSRGTGRKKPSRMT